jgi:CBS domain-containing protein
MGASDVFVVENKEQRKQFVVSILKDMKALEYMLEHDMFDRDTVRIGAEQEMCFIDRFFRPSNVGPQVLERLNDKQYTTELAKFNLETNLDPVEFSGDCLNRMEKQLTDLVNRADEVAKEFGSRVVLTGILPTIRKSDLEFENITPFPRYRALNDAMVKMRGGDFEFNIKGTDELVAKHDTMLFEACNTSFQVHLQIEPQHFVDKYNWAQAIAGPVLAACTNSPLLFGKRLWDETRIAVFEQTVDLKNVNNPEREMRSRVDFGTGWLKENVTEIFKYDIAYYKLLLASENDEDSLEELRKGNIPKLRSLTLHNGTIYKWNRPCYGITNGKPHLRIEGRYIPSGPTVIDEMANTAFWLGLMSAMPENMSELVQKYDFDHAKLNFIKAAQMGMSAQFRWIDGKAYTAQNLLLLVLIPLAQKGLESRGIDQPDIDRYMDIIRQRAEKQQTGSIWLNQSFTELKRLSSAEEAVVAVTAGMVKRQQTNQPVHTWDYPVRSEAGSWANKYRYVRQIMSKELYTVQEEDLVELVTTLMDWRKIHHVPVENEQGEVVGIISSGDIIKYYSKKLDNNDIEFTVNDIMMRNPLTVTADTLTVDALKIMRKHNLGCLPVVKEKKLIGIITDYDFVCVSEYLFEELEHNEAQKHHAV